MERSRETRSLLKPAALWCFAVAVLLCCLCSWAPSIGSSGHSTVLGTAVLHSDSGTRASAASRANQGDGCSDDGGGQWQQRRRLLLRSSSSEGPGSYPPRCTSKCGECNPCYPVHVAVPPGVPVTTEYYPEAWRCKCGNRLYMP